MKRTRKFAAFVASILAVACMAAPMAVSAAIVKVDIDGSSTGLTDKATHIYTAYQIFTGTYSADLGLTVTGWADGYKSSELLANTDFNSITIADGVTMGSFIGSKTDAGTVAQAIEKINSNSDAADTLAEIMSKYVGTTGKQITTDGVELSDGYYIVKDTYTVGTDEPTNDALSKYILKVAGGSEITITPKKSYPSVEKKVYENQTENYNSTYATGDYTSDVGYNDVADYSIGDSVKFELYGTLPSTLNDYVNGYKYVFHDTLASTLTYNTAVTPTVKLYYGNPTPLTFVATTDYKLTNNGNDITIEFSDIKKSITDNGITIDSEFLDNARVVVTYEATLSANAVIGLDGQENVVYLEYSNNPEWDGSGTPTTDKTPKDKVIVFTYELDTNKVDANTGAKLSGAKFKLSDSATGGQYAMLNAVDKQANTYTFGGWDTNGTEITTDAEGLFKIVGIDEGTYYLEETEAPEGYNKLTSRVKLQVLATTVNGQTWNGAAAKALTALSIKVDDDANATAGDVSTGVVENTIENQKGTSLPSTGGIGTTIFYAGGGALVVGAGVLLIAKKRMSNK